MSRSDLNRTVERRLGFLGGSFDPVHRAHLMAAAAAREALGLDRVVFVPAARSPFKQRAPAVSDRDRLALLEAAIAGETAFELSTVEIDRGGTSYTVATAEHFAKREPAARLFWIIGADQAACLDTWHRVDDLARLVEFIVLERPGYAWRKSDLGPGIRLHPIPAPLVDISSSEIRRRVRAGLNLGDLVPLEVATLIKKLQLYR